MPTLPYESCNWRDGGSRARKRDPSESGPAKGMLCVALTVITQQALSYQLGPHDVQTCMRPCISQQWLQPPEEWTQPGAPMKVAKCGC